ncbi:MAG: GGDEF domain-containing protein [Limnothrix sp.]
MSNLITAVFSERTLQNLEKKGSSFWITSSLILCTIIAFLDFISGTELAFSLFYLLPIALLTWFCGRILGFVADVACSLIWVTIEIASGQTYSHPSIFCWNTVIRFSFFLIITLLLSALKSKLDQEKQLARTDSLTGAINARQFTYLLTKEIERSHQKNKPFTIAYIDLDNFKQVNDKLGHSTGDILLRSIIEQLKISIRPIDAIARLGGDEFALLLPETNAVMAEIIVSRLQTSLLRLMQKNNWLVTFSIGVLTCESAPRNADEIISLADNLMYAVKHKGKNSISYAQYPFT